MPYILSGEGRRALRSIIVRPTLYVFDYEGFLAEPVQKAAGLQLTRSLRMWLYEAAARLPCIILTGYRARHVLPALEGIRAGIIASCGIEKPSADPGFLAWAAGICQGWRANISASLKGFVQEGSVRIEAETYYLRIHIATEAAGESGRLAVCAAVERLSPRPYVIDRDTSLYVLPGGERHGRSAVVKAAMVDYGAKHVCFFGQPDRNDLYLWGACLALNIRVGQNSRVPSQYYVKHRGEIEQVLRFLVNRCDGTPEPLESEQA